MTNEKPRYGAPGRAAQTIQLKLESIAQLFSSLDPFPFRDRDLDKDAEEYIFDWARELPRQADLQIVIHLPAAAAANVIAPDVEAAIQRYFRYRAEVIGSDLKQLFRDGRRALAIGLAMLGLCLVLQSLVARWMAAAPAARFLEEGLIILGWVANWKPLEIFLFDWWPLAGRRKLYERLARARIQIEASGG